VSSIDPQERLRALRASLGQAPSPRFDIELDLLRVSHSHEQSVQFLSAFRARIYHLLGCV
jgi:hypothetical protein